MPTVRGRDGDYGEKAQIEQGMQELQGRAGAGIVQQGQAAGSNG